MKHIRSQNPEAFEMGIGGKIFTERKKQVRHCWLSASRFSL
ncbi:MAG: hypothetical protein ACLTER_01700 [Ruminococcus sp.]